MRVKRRIVQISAILVLAAFAGFLLRHAGEPRYEGQPVSYWFKEYCYQDERVSYHDEDESKAEEVLLKIGIHALPYLLKQALDTNEDSAMRKKFKDFFDRLPWALHSPRLVEQHGMQLNAEVVIQKINPPAEVILPLLQNELNQPNTARYHEAIYILSDITNGAQQILPYLRRALHDSDNNTQYFALDAIGRLGPDAASAVPDLMEIIQTTSLTNQGIVECEGTLGVIGSNAYPALPLLKKLFGQETNTFNRFVLAMVLCQIDSQQTEAFDFLTGNLTNSDEDLIGLAALRLSVLGSAAKPAIPTLVTALSATNLETWQTVLNTLVELKASPELYLPIIKLKFKTGDEDSRMAAATFILGIEPTNQECQLFLMDQIRNQTTNETDAITTLGAAGLATTRAIPVVLGALDGTNFDSWSEIPSALTNMGAPIQSFLEKLEEKIKPDRSWNSALNPELFDVAKTVLQYDPANRDAQIALLRFPHTEFYIRTWSDANPVIDEVKTALHKALKSDDSEVRRAAVNSLKKIKSRERAQ